MRFDSLERYEIRAKVFHKITGLLAPGKDRPVTMGTEDRVSSEARWEAFQNWDAGLIDRTLDAVEEIMSYSPPAAGVPGSRNDL